MRFAVWATLVGALSWPAVSQASVRPLSAVERQDRRREGVASRLPRLALAAPCADRALPGFRRPRAYGTARCERLPGQPPAAGLRAPIRDPLPDPPHGLLRHLWPLRRRPRDGDVTASFECRQAVASPCNSTASTGTGNWSEHAYGEAIDLNPVENPYVGCGMTRDRTALSYLDRLRVRRGMVTSQVIEIFHQIGWGWGGSWTVRPRTTCTSRRPDTEAETRASMGSGDLGVLPGRLILADRGGGGLEAATPSSSSFGSSDRNEGHLPQPVQIAAHTLAPRLKSCKSRYPDIKQV